MRSPLLVLPSLVLLSCARAPVASDVATQAPPPAEATASFPEPQPPGLRLPDTVTPTRYRLALTLVPAEPIYSGTVSADVQVTEPVRQIWLHAQDLEVKSGRVVAGGRTLEARVVSADGGRLGLLLPEPLVAGQAEVVVEFSGKVNRDKSVGLYGQDERGEHYLYTFFEPIDARRAFPNFDEPRFKVPWQLTFTVKQEHVARANSPIVSEEPLPNGFKRVTFAESKPMPSYLVAFVVGPFDIVEGGKAGRAQTPVQFIVPRGRGPETQYAVSVTPRVVTVLEDFFDQPYPFEKLDVAVVPRYWGTMEHPGIVAMGQPLTLIRPGEETVARRMSYVHILFHELGHYWFGDVVTCRWWDDVWLNESLTSWLDQKVVDGFDPAWGFGLEAGTDARERALANDALVSALPVRKPVESNDDIIGSFDNSTTYYKGASLLRMFEGWLGEEKLREVMRRWVRTHAWGVVSADDFLANLEAEAGRDAAESFRSFVEQPGVPRITAELRCTGENAPRVVLAQERFLPAGSSASGSAQRWSVPVCVRAGSGTRSERACTLLASTTGELELPGTQCPSWMLLNAGGTGYYTSGYSSEQLQRLLSAPAGALSTSERLGLLSDISSAVERGDVALGDALKVVPSTASDANRLVLQRGVRLLTKVRTDRLTEEDRERWKAWLRELYGKRARTLGWKPKAGETDEVRRTRNTLLTLAASWGEDPVLVREGARLGRAWLKDRTSVSAEVVPLALELAAWNGDRALFEAMVAKARTAPDRVERARLLSALGHFRDPTLLDDALALVAGTEFDIRESRSLLEQALSRRETREAAWRFYTANFDALVARMRSDEGGWFIGLAANHCDEDTRAETERFLSARVRNIENGPRELTQTVEAIQLCAAQQQRHAPSVQEFLRSRGTRTR